MGATPGGAVTIIAQLLSVGVSVAITVIVAEQLWVSAEDAAGDIADNIVKKLQEWFGGFDNYTNHVCLMSDQQDNNLCVYAWVVCGVSWLANIVCMIAACMSSRTACRIVDAVFAVLAALWWLAFAIVATVYGTDADDKYIPREDYRTSVWAMGWAQLGLFVISLLASCCGGKSD